MGDMRIQKACHGMIPKHNGDVTSPATPGLVRAMAFDVAKHDSSVVPQPPPPHVGVPRRDPVLMEFSGIEIGAKLYFISGSDNPDVDYKACREWLMSEELQKKGDPPVGIYELPITGYDQNSSQATVVLDADMMKDKDLKPGEDIAVFQMDKNGNVSERPLEVYIDPGTNWAGQNIRTTNAAGQQVQVPGAQIQYQVGLHNVQGADQIVPPEKRGLIQQVTGLAVRDFEGPRVVEKNVTVKTAEWSQQEKDFASHLLNGPGVWKEIQRAFGGQLTVANMKNALAAPGNYNFGEKTLDIFKKLSDADKLFSKFDTAANGPRTKDGVIGDVDLREVVDQKRTTFLALEHAMEIGVSGTVTVHPGNQQVAFTIDNTRDCYVKLNGLETGHQIVIEYQDRPNRDGSRNAGKPVSFEYSADAATGKVGGDLLAMMGKGLSDVALQKFNVSGKEVRLVPHGLAPAHLGATPPVYTANNFFVTGGFAVQYETRHAELGLPLGNHEATDVGSVQKFEKGEMIWERNGNKVTVNIKP